MRQVLTLRELGERYGVDVGQIKRLVRVGALPEAMKENGPSGKRWVIPADKIEAVATRHGWHVNEINLNADTHPATVSLATTDAHGEQMTASQASDTGMQPEAQTAATTTLTDRSADVDIRTHQAAPTQTDEHIPPPSPMSLTPLRRQTDLQPPLPPEALKVKRAEPDMSLIPALSEVLNEDLLTRLLGAHEDKATAQARVKETERALTSLTASHRHVSMQLSEERKEREILAERLREERNTRLQSEAKVAELHQRVARETAIAESEQRARQTATDRSIKAERDAATALGSMGPVSRRKYDRRAKKRG